MWDRREVLRIGREALEEEARAIEAEQAVRGLDALPEVRLHPILAAGYERAGFGVVRERGLPPPVRSARLVKESERRRCDLVLLPRADATLADEVDSLRERARAAGTLFEALAGPAPGSVTCEECWWLEVKAVGQYTFTDGVPGPNRSYASELRFALRKDLEKFGAVGREIPCGMLLVLFTAGREVAEHDFATAARWAMDRGVEIRHAELEGFAIGDRIGNGYCAVGLISR